jgi:hypothetical protein
VIRPTTEELFVGDIILKFDIKPTDVISIFGERQEISNRIMIKIDRSSVSGIRVWD